MNIALFPSAFAPHFGGVEELSRQLALELRRQGHEVIVLTNRWPHDLPAEEQIDGIPVYRLPFRLPVEGSLKSLVNFKLTNRAICRRTIELLRRHEVEVMNVQCVSSNVLYALEARRQTGIPLVVTLQGELTMDATGLYQRSETARQLLRRALAEAEAITGCSARTIADAEAFVGHSFGSRARRVFNAARVEDFASATPHVQRKPYIFAVGRCVAQKGFDVLIRAFAMSGVTDHDLLIAGDGPELPELRRLAGELGVIDRLTFYGRADRAAVASLFAGCAFSVLPSRADEGLPVVCAEAMAAGKAIVATRTGGAPEAVIDGETGLIVEKDDVDGLSAALRKLADDAALRHRLAAAGKARAQQFAWPAIAEQYLEVYRQVLLQPAGQLQSAVQLSQG
jgi:glycogen synthase